MPDKLTKVCDSCGFPEEAGHKNGCPLNNKVDKSTDQKEGIGIKGDESNDGPELGGDQLKNNENKRREQEESKIEALRVHIDDNGEDKQKQLEVLSPTEQTELEVEIKKLKKDTQARPIASLMGNTTATEYDSHVVNYSTQTRIVTLSSGRKIFLINNYSSSAVHREMDAIMKFGEGARMRKAKSSKWKEVFVGKSRMEILPCDDPNTVALDYIPNLNMYDLFANRAKIKDFGTCDFATNITPEQLLEIVGKMTKKIEGIHAEGQAWGELILQNIIIDDKQNVHICDPEMIYNDDVPFSEQKARDLFDLVMSSAGTLNQSAGVDYSVTVNKVLSTYSDKESVMALISLAYKKPSLLNKIFFPYTKVRLGLKDQKEFDKIKEAIVDFKV